MLISKGQVAGALKQLRQVATDLRRANPATYRTGEEAFQEACERNVELRNIWRTGKAFYPDEFGASQETADHV